MAFHMYNWLVIAFGVALSAEFALSVFRGGKGAIFGFGAGFLIPWALWLLAVVGASIHGGVGSDEFGSVVGEGPIAALSLCTIWVPVGLVGLMLGLTVRGGLSLVLKFRSQLGRRS